jgi:tetrahydromethanopterin S-methyltransferase subunit C
MKLWQQLYALLWLSFLQIIVILLPGLQGALVDLHALIGFVILGLAHYNNVAMKRTAAPNRLKRTAKATAILATVQIILGLILYAGVKMNFNIPLVVNVITFIHLAIALAIITQAASVATAYDMWEDKEFSSPST